MSGLTIDGILKKYLSLGSATSLVANLRRCGLSPAQIEEAVARHDEAIRADAGQEQQQVERFRAELLASSRVKQITHYLSLFGSHERTIPLLEATVDEPDNVFWPV